MEFYCASKVLTGFDKTKHQCTSKDFSILRYGDWQRYAYCLELHLS
jgi:hypothetical protein